MRRAVNRAAAVAASPASPGRVPRTRDELREAKERSAAEIERLFAAQALSEAGGNVTHAAEAAGMDRTQFQHLLARHGLSAGDFRKA